MKALSLALVGVIILVIGYLLIFPGSENGLDSYSWSQKVTLTVQTEDGVFSSSTIQRVTWQKNDAHAFGGNRWLDEVQGEMPHILLPDGSLISIYQDSLTWYLLDFTDRNLDSRIGRAYYVDEVILKKNEDNLQGKVSLEIQDDFFPRLVKINDPSDLDTAEIFEPVTAALEIERTSYETMTNSLSRSGG